MKRYFPVLFIFIVWFVFSYPFFLQGRVPYSSTYQVNNYAPWSMYEKFWGPVKNGAMPDIITQMYPWRYFTIESWKKGQIALWNPYSFSGTPHLANYQSAVFSPFNILFLLPLRFVDAWSLLVLLQPLLAGMCMYLFVRTLKQSTIASLISSVSFMFCGFLTTWMGYGTLSLSISLLPLALFAVEKFYQTQKLGYLGILGVSIPFSFFSGHFQTSIYFFLFTFGYVIFKFLSFSSKTSPSRSPLRQRFGQAGHLEGGNARNTFYVILSTIFGLLISMPQILPSIEFYMQSVRGELFLKGEVIPLSYIPTLLSPDFFGNPVTRNDWFGHYAEWNAYAGVLPLLLALYSVFRKRLNAIFFFVLAGFVSIFLAFDTPLLNLLFNLKIPVLSTSAASRIIVLFSFSVAVLSGFGFDQLLQDIRKKNSKKIALWLGICFVLFAILWTVVMFKLFIPADKITIAKSNLILPTALFLGLCSIVLVSLLNVKKYVMRNTLYIILFLVAFDMLRFATKWTPFDPKELVFPDISVTKFFRRIAGYDRTLGNYEAGIGTYYHLPSLEGYDPLYIARYGEFVTSLTEGTIGTPYRSVVSFPRNGSYTANAIDFLGVSYIVHKKGDDGMGWTLPYWKYSEGQFQLIFEDAKYRIFKNKKSLPRAFLVQHYRVFSEPQKIIDTMFAKDFDIKQEVILEEHPGISWKDLTSVGVRSEATSKIINYQSNVVDIETSSDSDSILVLTDSYYPGWKGYVDDREVSVYRADYTFRGVVVPKGEHKVKFKYNPDSFRLGLYLAIIGIMGMIALIIFSRKSVSSRGVARGAKLIHPRGGTEATPRDK